MHLPPLPLPTKCKRIAYANLSLLAVFFTLILIYPSRFLSCFHYSLAHALTPSPPCTFAFIFYLFVLRLGYTFYVLLIYTFFQMILLRNLHKSNQRQWKNNNNWKKSQSIGSHRHFSVWKCLDHFEIRCFEAIGFFPACTVSWPTHWRTLLSHNIDDIGYQKSVHTVQLQLWMHFKNQWIKLKSNEISEWKCYLILT